MSADEKRLAQRYIRAIVATAYEGEPRSELDRIWEDARGHSWAFEPPAESDSYWSFARRIAAYDPLKFWRQVTVPALLLYGEKDERVPPRLSASHIAGAYLEANGQRLDVIFFPFADRNYRLRPKAANAFEWPRTVPGYPARLMEWVLQITQEQL
jgi:pimeloyl-ACP methyl ester carboxylesterase